MSASGNLSNYQFRFRPAGPRKDYPGYFEGDLMDDESRWDYSVHAYHKPTKNVVGEFLYDKPGYLFQVNVDKEHQRKGLATEMAKKANEIAIASKNRFPFPIRGVETEEGKMFGKAMEKKGYLRSQQFGG